MKQRQDKIKEHIRLRGDVKLSELCCLFPDVSEMTIRRDLEKLEKDGDIVRTKGGAKSIMHLSRLKEELFYKRASENVEEKRLIASRAASLIEEGLSIFLDSGSTLTYLSMILTTQRLFVTTSAPNIAIECAKNPNAGIYLTGGNLNHDNLTLSGVHAIDFLKNINIDIAFMGTSGYCVSGGFTCGSFEESRIKSYVIKKAHRVAMLMDSSKVDKTLPFSFADFSDINYLITDYKLTREMEDDIKKYEIEVI